MKTHYILITLFIVFLTSCDCYVQVEGQVLSSQTGKPISGALVTMLEKNEKVKTDAHGRFKIAKVTGFCFDAELEIKQPGYKPFQILLARSTDYNSYKVKSASKSVDFEQPVYPNPKNLNTFIQSTWIEKYSQSFKHSNDSLIVYLDEDNLEAELKQIQKKLENNR